LQFVSDTWNNSTFRINRKEALTLHDAYPDLSARQLGAVLALAEFRSFVAAANALKMSQPALTRTIQQVEAELGVPLFVRSTRQVSVTQAGKEFAAHAERLLNDLKISVASMRELADRPRGQIVVASVVSLANAVLPTLIAGYSRKFPGIEIHLREGLHDVVRDDIRSGLADFGIGYVDDPPEAFIAESLGTETFFAVLPKRHPLALRKQIDVRALSAVPLVSFPPDSRTRRVVDAAAAAEGLRLRYLMTTNRLPTLHGLVRNGVGLAVVPAIERPPVGDPDLVSRPLAGPRLSCQIGIMRLRERELTPAAGEFLAVVRGWLRTFRRGASGRGGARRGRKSP
jgi:DNA-binding transcriptional LysR family regulator